MKNRHIFCRKIIKALYTVLAMPNVIRIGPYHIAIYSCINKDHSIFSFKLMHGNSEIATYNMNTQDWQSVNNNKALQDVKTDIEYWLTFDIVQKQLKRRMYDALYCREIKPITVPIEKKELLRYIKEREKIKNEQEKRLKDKLQKQKERQQEKERRKIIKRGFR